MVALGKTWRFTFYNALGVDVATGGVVVVSRYMNFDISGLQNFSSDSVIFSAPATIVNATYASMTEVDNSSTKWLGGDFIVAVVAPSASNGRVDVYYERKVNGQWPTNGKGRIVCSLDTAAAGTFYKDFSI